MVFITRRSSTRDATRCTAGRMLALIIFMTLILQAQLQECPDVFGEFKASTYCFDLTDRSFDDARSYCQSLGGDLPIILSQEQNNFLSEGVVQNKNYWIGLSRMEGCGDGNSGCYSWLNGDPLSGHHNWENGTEPILGDCGSMFVSSNLESDENGAWDAHACNINITSICQFANALPFGNWAPLGDKLYYVSTEDKRNYEDARIFCQGIGGDLAQPRTKMINDLLSNISDHGNTYPIWIGLDDDDNDKIYQWADGTPLLMSDYMPWNNNEPIRGGCAHLMGSTWNIMICGSNIRFACESSGSLPDGSWISSGKNEYFMSPSWLRLSFQDAREYCQGLGGDIAQPKNQDAYNFLRGIIDNAIWIGLSDVLTEGTYVWIDGTELSQRPAWVTGTSMSMMSATDDCVTMLSGGNWMDQSCTNILRFVCQRSRVPNECESGQFPCSCNCLNGEPCEEDTGACLVSNGTCAVGYIPDADGPYDNCRLYSGCYDSCQNTCHCSGGASDCNTVTGSCFSNKCSLRWTGEKCQTDRFTIEVAKSNPGWATFNCTFSTLDLDQSSILGEINVAQNETLIDEIRPTISATMGIDSKSFSVQSLASDDIIYCTYGYSPNSMRPLVYARLPQRELYVLPQLNSTPVVSEVGAEYVVLRWREWDASMDEGDGPIIDYVIYIRTMGDDQVLRRETVSSSDSARSRRQIQSGLISHTVTSLEPDTQYLLSLSVVREGPGGEGREGSRIKVTTMAMIKPPTDTGPTGSPSSITAGIAGGVAGFLVILFVITILIICIVKRKRKRKGPKDGSLALRMSPSNSSTDYLRDEIDGYSGQEEPSTSPQNEAIPLQSSNSVPTPAERSAATSDDRPVAEVLPLTNREPIQDDRPVAEVLPMIKREPIPVAEFPAFVHKNRHTNFFSDEFEALPSGNLFKQSVAGLAVNFDKNRYKNILPYDATRVILSVINDDPTSDYFNASFIPNIKGERAYIASQGPNKASMDDFWRMVWQEKVRTIAVVTNLKEGNTIKCRQYWPNVISQAISFGSISVQLVSVKEYTGWVERNLVLYHTGEPRRLRQFHYTEWPDKGVPRHTSSLLKFLREVQTDHGQNEAPLLIHCSAGVGRSGVVIGIDGIVAEAKATGFVDVFNFVSAMRQNRPYMVQTDGQYEFLYVAVLEGLLWKKTSVDVSHISSYVAYLQGKDSEDGQTRLSKEFENLQMMSPHPPKSMYRSALLPSNQTKNRYGNILPLQRNRVMLRTHGSEGDYINASFLKGAHYQYISTAMPMSNTVSDFWAMIYDYHPSCIVMLNEEDEDESCEQYWPDEGSVSYDGFTISTSSTTRKDDVIIRSLRVHHAQSSTYHDVDQYQFLGWSKDTLHQDGEASSLLTLIDQVQESTDPEGYILVHCLNGVGRTGVFCTAMECIADIKKANNIDIFHTVKMLRADRTHFVQTEEDYTYLFSILEEYVLQKNYEQVYIDHATINEHPNSSCTDPNEEIDTAQHTYDNQLTSQQPDTPYENLSFSNV